MPFDELHDEKRPGVAVADVEDGHDIGMIERGRRLRLAQEAPDHALFA
jgi:hypothetical protein